MRRRLELARGLLHEPKILFLDEPTLGLDPQTREHLWGYIKRLSKEKKVTIIITTHYMEEADQLCDRLAIIDHGKDRGARHPEEPEEEPGRRHGEAENGRKAQHRGRAQAQVREGGKLRRGSPDPDGKRRGRAPAGDTGEGGHASRASSRGRLPSTMSSSTSPEGRCATEAGNESFFEKAIQSNNR